MPGPGRRPWQAPPWSAETSSWPSTGPWSAPNRWYRPRCPPEVATGPGSTGPDWRTRCRTTTSGLSAGRPRHALAVSPSDAVPALVEVDDGATAWTVVPDLLSGDRFAAECVVETEDDGRAYLRFGDDGCGRSPTPGTTFRATYRRRGRPDGNVGRQTLTRLTEPIPGATVRNPMPAQGGTDPEPVEQVRQWAPQAFRVQQRAVTDADYAEVAARHPQVRQARASRRWTGSWYTESVVVDRRAGLPRTAPSAATSPTTWSAIGWRARTSG